MLFLFVYLVSIQSAHVQVTSSDGKMASLQIVAPKQGKTKKLVYRFGVEGEQLYVKKKSKALITLNGEPLLTFQNKTFEIYSGFSTQAGIKITDPMHKFYYRDLVQPLLFVLEDFDGPFEGWNDFRISTCGEVQNYFLGGPCIFSNITASKYFVGLPDHNYLQINFNFHFIDKWTGEIAQLKVDKLIVWQDSYNWCDKVLPWVCFKYGINSCGGEAPDQVGQFISLTIRHIEPAVHLEFSTTLGKYDACTASWGVDNIAIYAL